LVAYVASLASLPAALRLSPATERALLDRALDKEWQAAVPHRFALGTHPPARASLKEAVLRARHAELGGGKRGADIADGEGEAMPCRQGGGGWHRLQQLCGQWVDSKNENE
jgi:hypothetical protein